MDQRSPFAAAVGPAKTTWVVLCTDATGRSVSEYVEGTELIREPLHGGLQIRDGGRLVREYSAGAWTNFCEWVTHYTDFLNTTVIRLPVAERTTAAAIAERTAAVAQRTADRQRMLATAMEMNTNAAISLLKSTLPRTRKTSGADGAVRTPTRLPGSRHA